MDLWPVFGHNSGMKPASILTLSSLEEAAALTPLQVLSLCQTLQAEIAGLKQQLEGFKRQIFGQKSERRIEIGPNGQMTLGDWSPPPASPPAPQGRVIAAHTRRPPTRHHDDEALPFFDETRVPVEVIELRAPQTEGLSPEDYEIVSHKESYRLAQRPGSYVVIKYRRPVVKIKKSQALVCAPAPSNVIDGSRADVSFVAGLLIDKFAYHLPLYRQHQRLIDAGFTVSRPWLTQIGQRGAALLEPIYEAQFASIRESRVKAMDETPIKAGQAGPGKLKQGYFWPVYGERDEICFPFFQSREIKHVEAALGLTPVERAVLLSDGYAAYARYAAKTGIIHAQCWTHTRRGFFEAQAAEPEAAAEALALIGELYAIEEDIRRARLSGEQKKDHRLAHAKPVVERFFTWVDERFAAQGLLPSNPLTQALAYARNRRFGLEVFLTDPDVPIDTNHLERALRVIPMGRRNWMFCWTELGARQVGILQSLIVTCRLHDINPYDYLVDVLQRVGQHPANRVHELTPRCWKQLFAANPLRSPLQRQAP
jgi:transposase